MIENKIEYLQSVLSAISQARSINAQHLDLSYLSASDIPLDLGELRQLTSLNLSGNDFLNSSIPGAVWRLTNLRHLNLSNSKITSVTSLIENLPNLESLNLSGNLISVLPSQIIRLSKLKSLKISRNNIKEIPPEVFELNNLKLLDVSNNHLSSLSKRINKLTNLSELYLNNTGLSNLPNEISELLHLTVLSAANNNLETNLESIWGLEDLISLVLSSNNISSLPSDIGKLKLLQHLYLTDNNLTELPRSIGELINLSTLAVSYNNLSHLPPELGNLRKLKKLYARNNQLTRLPTELENLTGLEHIYLSDNQLRDLSFDIGEIKDAIEINLSDNQLSSLPNTIGRLGKLTRFYISNNDIKNLPQEFGQLQELKEFSISNNKLETLCVKIGDLRNLFWLDISDNRISKFPKEMENLAHTLSWLNASNNKLREPIELVKLYKLGFLNLRNNPLPIPPEILKDSFRTAKFLRTFYAKNRLPLHEAKLIFIGQGSVGKTSLVRRLLNESFAEDESKTEGIAINRWEIENQSQIKLNIWDFGGQEIMHATHQFFLTKRSLYVLVFDVRLSEEENRVEYWLKIIQSFSDESPVLIVGNKIDQHPLDIDRTGLQKKYPNIVGILETSAATSAGIENLKAAIAEQVNNLPHVRDLLPETWFTVKTKLEELGKQSNFITHDKYLDLCAENEVSDETSQRTLIGFLHDLGVVLHFQDDPRLEALGILNPQWVTNGVYKILNSHTLFQNKGVLTVPMLDEILNLPEYPRGKRIFIVDMMKKFELCYDIEADKTFLIPDLLPKDEPATDGHEKALAFQYHYTVLPSSVITRFIVRMNEFVDEKVWRTGAILKDGGSTALVKADIEDRKVFIGVGGDEHKRHDFLSKIRGQFDTIHKTISKLEVKEMVPVSGHPEADPVDYDLLLQMDHNNVDVYPVLSGGKMIVVKVREMLNGVARESDRQRGNITNFYINGDMKDSTIIAGDENEVNK